MGSGTIIKRLRFLLLTCCSTLFLASCWFPCAPALSGIVRDDSNLPVGEVKIELYGGNNLQQIVYSDSLGRFSFDLESKSVFFTKKCRRDFTLVASKDGYKNLNYKNEAPKVNIVLQLKQ